MKSSLARRRILATAFTLAGISLYVHGESARRDPLDELQKNQHALQRDIASLTASQTPAGVIEAWGGRAAPPGWLLCDGRELSADEYKPLFGAIGRAFGGSVKKNTFRLPDFRGRFLRGVCDGDCTLDEERNLRQAMSEGGAMGAQVGSVQSDALLKHTHKIKQRRHNHGLNGLAGYRGPGSNGTTGHGRQPGSQQFFENQETQERLVELEIEEFGDPETRPKNAYVNFIIRF